MKIAFQRNAIDMYNMSGLAGEPSIEDIGGIWRARSDADDSYDELAMAGTGKDVVLMATGVKFSDRAKPPH